MAFRQFLNKYVWVIVSICTAIFVVVTIALLYADGSRNIEEQVLDLYHKDKLVQQDFSKASDLSGVTCYINEQHNIYVFKNEDCWLKVKYSKAGEVLTKEFKDERLGSNIGVAIALVFASMILGFCVSFLLIALLDTIARKIYERGQAKITVLQNDQKMQ